MRQARDVIVATAVLVALSFSVGRAAPDRHAGQRLMAQRYETHGLVDKAVAEYLKILGKDPEDSGARSRVRALVALQMPSWLPEAAETGWPFPHEVIRYELTGPMRGGEPYRLLVTQGAFTAPEGARWDQLHEKGFSRIDYTYVWHPIKKIYEVRVAAHWNTDEETKVAEKALHAVSAFYCLVKDELGFDPTGRWADPIDIWVTGKGEPGARAQGRSIYLYAVGTERTPGEWLRELGHEYGHVSLPGLGGFKDSDDEWADGDIAELLFPKWLSARGVPEWMPWSVQEWEAASAPERERLMGRVRSKGLDPTLVGGTEAAAREYLVGLALLVEDEGGAEGLSQVLRKCPQGTTAQFLSSAEAAGVEVWEEGDG